MITVTYYAYDLGTMSWMRCNQSVHGHSPLILTPRYLVHSPVSFGD